MLFRGKFLRDGKIVVRGADVELTRTVQDGVNDWAGSFMGPAKSLLGGQKYQLLLDNGRTADIQLEKDLIDPTGPEKISFTVTGGFQ